MGEAEKAGCTEILNPDITYEGTFRRCRRVYTIKQCIQIQSFKIKLLI